jgi:uncharacterized membrane protein
MTYPFGRTALLPALAVFLLAACSYDQVQPNVPPSDCPTDQVGFAANIAPIVASKCQSCHHVANPSGGVRLDGHAQIANEALGGDLLCAVKHLQGCKPMPQGSAKLPDCEIRQIEAWIEAGAPNN